MNNLDILVEEDLKQEVWWSLVLLRVIIIDISSENEISQVSVKGITTLNIIQIVKVICGVGSVSGNSLVVDEVVEEIKQPYKLIMVGESITDIRRRVTDNGNTKVWRVLLGS